MTEATPHQRVALGAGTLAVTAWSFGPILVRAVDASTSTVAFWRLWLAQPVMIGVAYLTGGRLSWDLVRRTLLPGMLFGAALIASYASYQHTSIANATLIGALQPAVMLFVGPRLFGDRTSRHQQVAACVALAGMALVVLAGNETSGAGWTGDVYALINLALWTVYFIKVKRQRDLGVHAASLLAGVFLTSAIVATPWALVSSDDLGSLDVRDYAFVVLMIVGPGLIGHGMMTWTQRHLDITIASMLTLLHPVLSTVEAWLIYDERLDGLQFVGAAVVLVALGAIIREAREAVPEVQEALPVAAD